MINNIHPSDSRWQENDIWQKVAGELAILTQQMQAVNRTIRRLDDLQEVTSEFVGIDDVLKLARG